MQKTVIPSWDRGEIPGDDTKMAIGAIFFSMPAAAFGALYLSLLHGLNPAEGLLLYSAMGSAMLMAVPLLSSATHD